MLVFGLEPWLIIKQGIFSGKLISYQGLSSELKSSISVEISPILHFPSYLFTVNIISKASIYYPFLSLPWSENISESKYNQVKFYPSLAHKLQWNEFARWWYPESFIGLIILVHFYSCEMWVNKVHFYDCPQILSQDCWN